MPMTVAEENYAALMVHKGIFNDAEARAHHKRVAATLARFDKSDDAKASGLTGRFGAVNVGVSCSWWDYGQLQLYLQNGLLLTEDSDEGQLARRFFAIPEDARAVESSLGSCKVDKMSVISSTKAKSGTVAQCSIANVCANDLQATGAVLVNVCAKKIVAGKGAVAYNVVDNSEGGLTLAENEVRVGVFHVDKPYFVMKSNVAEIDGGKFFKEKVCANEFSFQEVYDLNHGVDVQACGVAASAAFDKLAKEIFP